MAKSNAVKTKKIALIKNYRELRRNMNLSQTEFWNRIGVTQSAGCRYEKGRKVFKPIAMLAYKVYILGDDMDANNFED